MKNIKKVLLALLFVGSMYFTAYSLSELNFEDWYWTPTVVTLIGFNGACLFLLFNEFIEL